MEIATNSQLAFHGYDIVSLGSIRLVLQILACIFMPAGLLYAHPEGFSGMHVTINDDHIHVAITVHTRDMDAWFPPGQYPDYVADITREMERTINEIVEIQFDGQPQPMGAAKAFLLEVGLIEIDANFQLPKGAESLEFLIWSKHLIHLPRGHQQLLFVEDRRGIAVGVEEGVILLDDVLSVERDAAALIMSLSESTTDDDSSKRAEETSQNQDTVESQTSEADEREDDLPRSTRTPNVGAVSDEPTSRISFFLFGVEHIIAGYDHLLFLAALLLACSTFGEAATIITCFTVAHSITLALAALDVVRLPGSIVEPLIALSIVYVAVENLAGTHSLWRRAAITCCFGLIHGLGFASALRELGLGTIPGGIVWPLLKFNLGVEAGQLCVAAVILPLLLWMKQKERVAKMIVPSGSIVVAAIGTYWFVTRVFGE